MLSDAGAEHTATRTPGDLHMLAMKAKDSGSSKSDNVSAALKSLQTLAGVAFRLPSQNRLTRACGCSTFRLEVGTRLSS